MSAPQHEQPGGGARRHRDVAPELADLLAWFALRRALSGGVAVTGGGRYVDHGRPVPKYLGGVLAELVATGQLAVAAPNPASDAGRVGVSAAGHVRYAQLCRREHLGNLDIRMVRALSGSSGRRP